MIDERNPRGRMVAELLPPAIDELHRIIMDPKAKDADKISAIKVAMTHTLGPAAPRQNRAPEDMTAAELADRMAELRVRSAALADAAKMIDLTPMPAPAAMIFD